MFVCLFVCLFFFSINRIAEVILALIWTTSVFLWFFSGGRGGGVESYFCVKFIWFYDLPWGILQHKRIFTIAKISWKKKTWRQESVAKSHHISNDEAYCSIVGRLALSQRYSTDQSLCTWVNGVVTIPAGYLFTSLKLIFHYQMNVFMGVTASLTKISMFCSPNYQHPLKIKLIN